MAQWLELLLIQFLVPDNDARRQAEEQIKQLAKDPQVVPAVVHHLGTAKTSNVRQLSAVLLRKKITLDPSPSVRQASANVVSVFAKHAVPARAKFTRSP